MQGDWQHVAGFAGVRMTQMLVLSAWWVEKLRKFRQTSVIDQATTILAHRARMGPQVSPRALPLTRPYTPRPTVLGGASGLRAMDGLERSFTTSVLKKLGQRHKRSKAWKGHTSRPTQQLLPFPPGCSLLMHTPYLTRRLVPDDRGHPASEGLAQRTSFWFMHRPGFVT